MTHQCTPQHVQQFLQALRALLDALPSKGMPELGDIDKKRREELRADIGVAIQRLSRLSTELDPTQLPPHVLDPADPLVLGRLIAQTLLEQPRHLLKDIPAFYGSGVYALYYTGDSPIYKPAAHTQTPLYVGKADPAAERAVTTQDQGTRLWRRLDDHRRSIDAAQNLQLADFECRYLVVKSAWQNTAETYLIERFRPIWNNETGICYGFGKHGDSADTRRNTRSPWDTLHPGRKWALGSNNVPYEKGVGEIADRIAEHFRTYPPE